MYLCTSAPSVDDRQAEKGHLASIPHALDIHTYPNISEVK